MLTKLTESTTLRRDCEGILIPDGIRTVLPAGSTVTIKQSLGGDYTVRTDCGDMVRVAGKDADALGREVAVEPQIESSEGLSTADMVWEKLKTVYDPEIPVNIIDLGLVYDCDVEPLPGGGRRVEIQMTLTAPGCGMGEVLKRDVEQKVLSLPGVNEVHVELVFDPPWSQNRMSDVAKLELGLF